MVYFGKRVFKTSRKGLTARDKVALAVPTLILVVVFLCIVVTRGGGNRGVSTEDLPLVTPSIDRTQRGAPRGPVPTGEEHAGVDLPTTKISPPPPALEPAPFVPEPRILDRVRDGGLQNWDEPLPVEERVALIYLFHRWRAGFEVPIEETIPNWERIPARAPSMRGRRYELYLEVVGEPRACEVELPDNPSGVKVFWEVWAVDLNTHLHRLLFTERDRAFPEGTPIVVEADFLRLHEYIPRSSHSAFQVPQWITQRLRPVPPPERWSWQIVLLPFGIGLLGVLFLVVTQMWPGAERRYQERRQDGRTRGPTLV